MKKVPLWVLFMCIALMFASLAVFATENNPVQKGTSFITADADNPAGTSMVLVNKHNEGARPELQVADSVIKAPIVADQMIAKTTQPQANPFKNETIKVSATSPATLRTGAYADNKWMPIADRYIGT